MDKVNTLALVEKIVLARVYLVHQLQRIFSGLEELGITRKIHKDAQF